MMRMFDVQKEQCSTTGMSFIEIIPYTLLPKEYFALHSKHFEATCSSRSVLIGTPGDFKRFYLEEVSVPTVYAKPKDSLDIDY